MNGNVMYEVARQRIAEQQRAARQASEERQRRAIAHSRHAGKEKQETVVAPAIPDFADEMFDPARGAAPAPAARGRGTRASR